MGPMSERFEMRLDGEVLAQVDRWRAGQEGLPSRAEAMRRLIELGLARAGSETVRFSDGEKLLVIMMADIYKGLKVHGEIDPSFISEVIWGGHYWAAKMEMSGLFHDHQDDPRDLHFVMNVLDMWDFLERAYENLPKKEKVRIEKEADPFGRDVKFRGFDGNNETTHMGMARFLVEKMHRWPQFKGRELNAHCPTLATYRRMLDEFQPMRKGLGMTNLTADQLIQILKANK